jgi:RNA polymerase sigma-70 factor (ECF subfamily)
VSFVLPESDENLIDRCISGDLMAFDQLVERYQQKVYNMAFRMSGNHEDALDWSQESFLRAYRALDQFRGQSAFGTWLFRITTNTCLDELRKRKRQPLVVLSTSSSVTTEDGDYQVEFAGPEEDTPEERTLSKELQETVHRALQLLSSEHRTVLVLRDLEGHAYEDIADTLGVNIGTVKSRINRARIALREQLEAMEQKPQPVRLRAQRGG